ncbi:ATP-binding protein [Congregibacter variabilis]|uniref:histidine kinase n=1 Tax=Congregibacter variabilis TaxID=3081200 RepID=A0ABZ0HX61_9GAMM|nr:ATP-binding protein [Congregibacter sp. IMCC43200]
MNFLYLTIPSIAMLVALALLYRQRREYQQTFEELPTGLCVVGADHRVQRWNRQMSNLSGIAADDAITEDIANLPSPWPAALSEALKDAKGKVIKQSLGYDDNGGERWVILHSSDLQLPGRKRQILVEDITDYQRLQDELLHNERLASIGRLAAGVAHEIGNPVTGIACIAQNLADNADATELELGTSEILKQTERISRTVSSLMQLSHPGSVPRDADCVPCNLADCIDEAAHLLSLDIDMPAGHFENLSDRELLVKGDGQLLLQVFLNLLDNARSAAAQEGPVVIDAHKDGDSVIITVDNPGPAISPDVLSQVFEPFYTTKDVGEGTGLGLALVRRMLEDMGGSVSLLSPSPRSPGIGVRARVVLSCADYGQRFE